MKPATRSLFMLSISVLAVAACNRIPTQESTSVIDEAQQTSSTLLDWKTSAAKPPSRAELQTRAEAGNADAAFQLGIMYYEGKNIPQNYDEAMKWFKTAADLGNSQGMFYTGVMYYKALSVPKDVGQATIWFQKASDLGNAHATFDLGTIAYQDQNYDAARAFFEKAANAGYGNAQFNLGIMYFKGQGMSPDLQQAETWLILAERNGVTKAGQVFLLLRPQLSPDQMTAAETQAAAFQPTNRDSDSIN